MTRISTRARMLATAVTALSATGAYAVDASVTTNLGSFASTVVGSVVSGDGAAQFNSNTVNAGVTGSTITTTVTGASTGSFVNSGNTADALAQGNRNGTTISLATISGTADSDGIGIATVSINTGAITASAVNQDAGAILTGFTSGSVDVSANSIDATTIINDGSGTFATTINNSLPVGYTNQADANNASTILTPTVGTTNGTLVAANSQITSGPDSSAVAGSSTAGDENTVLLTLGATLANTVTGSAVLDDNNIGATFTGNTRTTSIGIASDTARFAGTAAITNTQSFDGNTTADNALNQDSRIAASVAGTGVVNSFSNASLSVQDNAITSAASGNVMAGTITLANALSYDTVSNNAAYADVLPGGFIEAQSDLLVASQQVSTGGNFLSALTDGAILSATVQQSVGSAIDLSGNRVTAAATNNSLSSAVRSGTGSALLDGSVNLANSQLINALTTRASVTDTQVSVTVGNATAGLVQGGSAAMDANIIASSAIGNQASQTAMLDAATLTMLRSSGSGTNFFPQASAGVQADGTSLTNGAVNVNNNQVNTAAPVSATTTGTSITLTSNDSLLVTAGADLSVTGNIQQAFAQGSNAGNTIGLAGVNIGAGAAISNAQTNLAGSTVTATQTGTATLAVTASAGGASVAAPSLTLAGNRSEALATGVTAANSLSANAGTATFAGLPVTDPDGAQTLPTPFLDTQAAYALFNSQTVEAAVAASAAGLVDATAFALFVGDDVVSAETINDSNRLTAQAQGAVVANAIDLNIGTINVTGTTSAPVGSVMNVQTVNANVTATAAPNGSSSSPAVVRTNILDDVTSSSVSTSANRATAIADGAVSSNMLSASGTSLSVFDGSGTGADAGLASVNGAAGVTTNAAFSLINAQANLVEPTVRATLRQVGNSATVATAIGGEVTGSDIVSDGNQLTALASSLETSNSLMLDGTTLRTTGALLNLQDTRANVFAEIGVSLLPRDEGVIVTVGDNISGSSISVAGNSVTGQALGNVAANTLAVSATTLSADGANANADAQGALVPSTLQAIADADFALANAQSARSDSSSTATIFNNFAIEQTLAGTISNSTLAVDGNAQVAEAMANTATNVLSVTATNIGDATAALANTQGTGNSGAGVNAFSDMAARTNIESSGSTISIDDNSNRAIGVINNASNTLSVAAGNIDGIADNAVARLADATGSFALTNVQSTTTVDSLLGPVLSTNAVSTITNVDTGGTSAGVVNGAVSMANNLTFAESSANRAANSLSVAGGASNAAPAALSNDQNSTATVSSEAQTLVSAALQGTATTTAALNGSALSVAGNATQALARGNTATNAMVFTAGADFGTPTTGATADGTAGTATAAAAMLNRQANSGSVGATATATYEAVLNSGGMLPDNTAVLNGAVSVSGNTVAATAFGNQATNRMELAVLNSGNATAAFNNVQSNSGVITASANNVTFASSVTGRVTNGAFRNVGNAASATAVGNSSITTIIGR